MTKYYNQRIHTDKTISLNGQETPVYAYLPSTLNQGSPWTIGEILKENHGSFISNAIIQELKIDPMMIVFDLVLLNIDFKAMTGDEVLEFWRRFGG